MLNVDGPVIVIWYLRNHERIIKINELAAKRPVLGCWCRDRVGGRDGYMTKLSSTRAGESRGSISSIVRSSRNRAGGRDGSIARLSCN